MRLGAWAVGTRQAPGLVLLAGILLAGAANFSWQLGRSSFYVDEVLSIRHAVPSLSGVIDAVRMSETTPPTYFLLLHEWLYRAGSRTEWVARLPSVVAAVALVGVIYWMARMFVGGPGALLAALLGALSPSVLEYGQQARAYVFVMLAVVLAVGAAVRAASPGPRQVPWLGLAGLSAVAALGLHYTAAFVVVPLVVWVAGRSTLTRRARVVFAGSCMAAGGALVPFFLDQYHYAPDGGVVGVANLSAINVARVLGAPFDGRTVLGLGVVRVLAAAVVVLAGVTLAPRQPPGEEVRDRHLLIGLALFAPLVILALAIAGKDVALNRYVAVAVPFMIVAIAAAATRLPHRLGLALAVGALVLAVMGTVNSHGAAGQYLDARGVVDYIHAREHPGDLVLTPGLVPVNAPLAYYGEVRGPVPPYVDATDRAKTLAALSSRRRIWIVTAQSTPASDAALLSAAAKALALVGYRPLSVRLFDASARLLVTLAAPAGP